MKSQPERSGRTRAVAVAGFGILMYAVGVQSVVRLMLYLTFPDTASATPPSALRAAGVDILLVLAFALHHSVMARDGVKRWLRDRLPRPVERSAYVGVSGWLLMTMIARWQPLPGTLWDASGTSAAFVIWAGYASGWTLSMAAVIALNQFQLFGLLGSLREIRGLAPLEEQLRERGPYRVIRHPMYTGFVIAAWAAPVMDSARILLAASLTLYAIVGATLEETDLLQRFGDAYRTYRARVPACLPTVPRRTP